MSDSVQRTSRLSFQLSDTIEYLDLNLKGMAVLTEIASGNYIVTPLIAALAGADKVFLTGRDSRYGLVRDHLARLHDLSKVLHIRNDMFEYVENKNDIASDVNTVTNLGFVRPIDDAFICRLPEDAGISLMFESWEFRKEDIDIGACIRRNIPVLGVNERYGELNIFRYVGISVVKALLENKIEIFRSRILLISSGVYLEETEYLLRAMGAEPDVIDTSACENCEERSFMHRYDAVVIAEQVSRQRLLGEEDSLVHVNSIRNASPVVIHIVGNFDTDAVKRCGLTVYPEQPAPSGHMSFSTDYVGIRPVIELNTAGLKVGQSLVEGMRMYHDYKKAQEYALLHAPALMFQMDNHL